MHIRKLSATRPVVGAYNIEAVLDIVLQVIVVLQELQNFLGVDIAGKINPGGQE
ncbi:MAG: hypothetical protein RBU21_14805 [FCB group bacterium]|jgi:hypothetical protein|nr:hypothetical protein [FCB group bacterium]